MASEQVLVIAAKQLSLPAKKYINDQPSIDSLFQTHISHQFLDRAQAEINPAYKQLIPYVTVTCCGYVLALERTAAQNEARLHGMLSLGVGGHINPVDARQDLASTVAQAMLRELAEEMHLEPKRPPRLVGLINDNSNAVGSVHLGLHYLLAVASRPQVREREKMNAFWFKPTQLAALAPRLETWSQILLPQLFRAERLLKQ